MTQRDPAPTPLTRAETRAWIDPPLWGMVHLRPLPGSPRYDGDPHAIVKRAVTDAQALVEAGYRGVVVENYGDTPFFAGAVPAVTVAGLTRAVAAIRERWSDLRITVNCLRNDAASALSVAAATGSDAIRVNVHVGASLTDQGIVEGDAAHTLRRRAELAPGVRILADVRVKHAAPLAPRSLEDEALDLRERGMADVILLTGAGTGRPAVVEEARRLRSVLPDAPLFVASGVTEETAGQWASEVDGAIVGSALMHDGRAGHGVDIDRARAIRAQWSSGARAEEA